MTTSKGGRPKGYSPGPRRVITHQVGEWAWNTDNLHKRLIKTTDDECWAWTGSSNPMGNIFGAYKNGQQQMTQANRLFYMEKSNEPIDNLAVRMKCGNKHCSNPNHFYIAPYNRTKS